MPEVTVVIVSYNTMELTLECLQSVVANKGNLDVEIIVVDNASTDGSAESIETDFPEVRLIRNCDNRGFAAANNQGFAVASGEFILLLNSDTVILGSVLTESVRFLREHGKNCAMGCRVLNTDRSLQKTCSREPTLLNLSLMTLTLDKLPWPKWFGRYQYRHWDRKSERDVDVISGCYLMLPRTIMNEVGILDEDYFFFGEETDWCHRIRNSGFRTVLAPVGEIIHHGGGSVRKFKAERDVMLTAMTVLFHLKNYGLFSASLCWILLLIFNGSRWAAYCILGLFSSRVRARRDHFCGVLAAYRKTWPRVGRPAFGAQA